MIMVSITVAIGGALWASVNSTAGTTLAQYTDRTAQYVNQVNEDFVITIIAFDTPVTGNVTVWMFNNGGLATEINGIFFGNVSTSLSPVTSFSPNPLSLAVQQSANVTFVYTTNPGDTYYVLAIGNFGNTASSYSAK